MTSKGEIMILPLSPRLSPGEWLGWNRGVTGIVVSDGDHILVL